MKSFYLNRLNTPQGLLNTKHSFFRRFSSLVRPLTLHDYYDNLSCRSAFLSDVSAVMRDAETYLNARIQAYKQTTPSYKLAIVLDIDDTSLSHYKVFKKNNFYITPQVIESCYQEAASPAVRPVLNFYQKSIEKNVSLFFITARKPLHPSTNLCFLTKKNLNDAGFRNYAGLFLPEGKNANLPTVDFKTRIRKSLEEERGYKIILNIGDQQSDLDGGHAEKSVRIPNYLYGTSSLCRQRKKTRCSKTQTR